MREAANNADEAWLGWASLHSAPTGGSVLPRRYPERSDANGATCKLLT
jgi:hypothetical protein